MCLISPGPSDHLSPLCSPPHGQSFYFATYLNLFEPLLYHLHHHQDPFLWTPIHVSDKEMLGARYMAGTGDVAVTESETDPCLPVTYSFTGEAGSRK